VTPDVSGEASGLVLYVREGCHLCDMFLIDLELDLADTGTLPAVVDVDSDGALAMEFGLRVPVLTLGGKVICEGRYESPRVRDALQV
jgi:hypothetical protein